MSGASRAVLDLVQQSPRWRYALFMTAGVTALAILFPPTCTSSITPPRTPYIPAAPQAPIVQPATPQPVAPPSNPDSDQRLKTFTAKVAGSASGPRAGFRCEQLVEALNGLDTTDRTRVSLQASPPAKAAQGPLATADNCQQQISASNDRFLALSRAVAMASSGAGIADAVRAYKVLNDFDRSRDRYSAEAALVAKGQHYAEVINTGIQHGPEIGLSPQTRDRIPLYVSVLPQSGTNTALAEYLGRKLAESGFQVVHARDDAALAISVTLGEFQQQDQVKIDGRFFGATSTIAATVNASWTANSATLFSDQMTGTGSLKYLDDQRAAQHVNAEAEKALIDQIIARLRK